LTPKRRSWGPTYRHVRAQVFMAKRDPASRTGWLTHRLKRTGMSIAAQYRVHAAEFLSIACKMNDSCQTSELINKALYWFNMAERGESQISENPTDVGPSTQRRAETDKGDLSGTDNCGTTGQRDQQGRTQAVR
jgi:hypothetical protein